MQAFVNVVNYEVAARKEKGRAHLKADSATGDGVNPGSTDDGLIEGIKERDEQAWIRFVDMYSPLIYVWCRRFDLQSCDARDVSQQVLHSVSRSIGTFSKDDGKGTLRGWLFTITRNSVRNYLTRTLRGPRAQGGSTIQNRLLQEPESVDEESISMSLPLSQSSSIQEILDVVRDEFDDRTWKCFWLVAIEGNSAVEVAERFGMQPAAVRQAKYRITKRLRRELDDFRQA